MSKIRSTNKNKQVSHNDIDNKVVEPIVELENEKPKKKITVQKDDKTLVETSDVTQKDTKRKKLSKNELYKDDQDNFFDKIKSDTLCIGESKSFSSKYLKKHNDKIIKEILEGMKKYYHNEMYKGISGTDNKTSLSLIKKLCDHHGYDVVKKEIKTEDDRWYVYYIVSKHKEQDDNKSF